MEIINPYNRHLHTRYTIMTSKQLPNGIIFPTHVLVESLTEAGRVYHTSDNTLVDATFNKNADLNTLKKWVPKGTVLNDFRFGAHNAVRYRTPEKLPDDASLRLFESRIQTAESEPHQRKNGGTILLLVSLVIISVVALVLYRFRSQSA